MDMTMKLKSTYAGMVFCSIFLAAVKSFAMQARPIPAHASHKPTTSAHAGFIPLPNELRGRSMVHVRCDCNDLVRDGHFCGSHALTHAVDDDQTYDVRQEKAEPSEVVKTTFAKLNISNNQYELTRAANIKTVAEELGLESVFLEIREGVVVSPFCRINEVPVLAALKHLDGLRKAFIAAGNQPMIKHVFFCFDEHVALFSIIWDGEEISIKIHDNLNKPIKLNSPLFTMADFLARFFVEVDRVDILLKDLVGIFAEPNNQAKYLGKFAQYRNAKSEQNQTRLLEYLFEQWVNIAKENSLQEKREINLKPLNTVLKPLKQLHAASPTFNAKELIIKTYDTMLDVINESPNTTDKKAESLVSVTTAIKRSAKEQKLFSLLDEDVARLLEKAMNMKTSLNQY